MTDDLTTFLRAQLDEDERVAAGSGIAVWLTYRNADGSMYYTTVAASNVEAEGHWVVDGREATGWSSAKVIHDERRVLAEVEAKRRIVDEHDTVGWQIGDRVHDCQWSAWPCATLRLLALPYADRPGYRDEWKP